MTMSHPNLPAPLPLPTTHSLPPKMDLPTSNTPSLPSFMQTTRGLAMRAEPRLSNQMGRSCIASQCPSSASNGVVSRPHPLSSLRRKGSRNRMATMTMRAGACIRVRTHVPTLRQTGSSLNRFGFPLMEARTTFVLSSEVNGVTYPRANDGGRMPSGDPLKLSGGQI